MNVRKSQFWDYQHRRVKRPLNFCRNLIGTIFFELNWWVKMCAQLLRELDINGEFDYQYIDTVILAEYVPEISDCDS